MVKAKAKSAVAKGPWWLGEGEEECAHCGGSYFVQVEFRCTDCDGPTCPHCKVLHAEGHFTCPDCVAEKPNG